MQPIQHTISTSYPVGPVHCYSTEINGEPLLIDTGPPTEECKLYLKKHIDLHRLQHVIITHCHIDHYGLAAWLERKYNCTIYLPYRDGLKIANHFKRLNGMTEILAEIGFDQQFLRDFRADIDNESVFPEFPQQYKIIEQDLPADFGIEAIPCPGHSQSDLVFVGGDWAITGDTMLREIFQSPMLDIDLQTGKRFSNYDAYCETIVKLAGLRDKIILPGHREFIVGIDNNICYYTGKLLERARRSRRFADLTPPQVVEKLFDGSLQDPFMKYLKASEVVFVRDFLDNPERLKTSLEQIELYSQLEELFQRATCD